MHRIDFEHAARHAFRIDKPETGICPGCKGYTLPEDFKQTPYGDYLCRHCIKQDAIANPEIYQDPLSADRIWHGLVDSLRATHNRIRTITDPREYAARHGILAQCALCEKAASERNRAEAWVRIWNVDGIVCRSCYLRAEQIVVGEYNLDSHNRCFVVTEQMQAKYPFGIRPIPKLHVKAGANKAIWILQHDQMQKLAAENFPTALKRIEHFYNRRLVNTRITFDDAYDVGVNTLLIAASLFKPELYSGVSFSIYLSSAIDRELKRLVFRKKYQEHYTVYLDEELLLELPNRSDEFVDAVLRTELKEAFIAFCTECENKVGKTNWCLFTANLLENRTHEELGRAIGVIQQTISARLKVVRMKCAEIAETNPQWKELLKQTRMLL